MSAQRLYRAMLGDTFINVLAESEEEAQREALQHVLATLDPEDFIVWEEPNAQPTPRPALEQLHTRSPCDHKGHVIDFGDDAYVAYWCKHCGALRTNDTGPWKFPSNA